MSEDENNSLIRQFGTLFDTNELPQAGSDILMWLEGQVKYLLDHDFNRLVNLLYRIDVYESKAKNCFGKSNAEIAKCLALLIYERQTQKFKNRS